MSDWVGTLRKCSLNGIEFPVIHCRMDFSQDIVQHKYPNVPGAQVESMSRNPLVFEVRAIFTDNVKGFTNLFPQTFQNVLRVLNDDLNETTKFVHPTLGKFNVKVVHGSTETTFELTNGQIIDFSLVEDGNNDSVRQDNILGVDEVSNATQSATNLDANISAYMVSNPSASIALPNVPQTGSSSFSSLLAGALAPVQQASIAIGTAFATASDAVAQVNIARNQLFALGDARTSYMMTEMETINSALNDQRCNQNTRKIYTVRTEQTLSQVMKYLLQYNDKLTIEKLQSLNPQFKLTSTLQVGTVVYWA